MSVVTTLECGISVGDIHLCRKGLEETIWWNIGRALFAYLEVAFT